MTYALSDRRDIAIPEKTRERVRSIARELGYTPHAAAQALASGRSNTVTVALPIRIGAHYAHVLQAFERETNRHGYHMVASTIGHVDIGNVEPDLSAMLTSLADGIILVDMPAVFTPYIDKTLPAAKPLVSVGVFTVPGLDSVAVNLTSGTDEALKHLLAAHPQRLAFFGPGVHDNGAILDSFAAKGELDPRIFAYCDAMKRAGRPLEIIAGSPDSRNLSREALTEYIAERGCPDALFCFNDEMAIGANRALRELGFRVPDDVLLVGCDGTEEGEYMTPGLSTIAQPMDKMCATAWQLMVDRLNTPERPVQQVTVDAVFVSRQSSEWP